MGYTPPYAMPGIGFLPLSANPFTGLPTEQTTQWFLNDSGIYRPSLGDQRLALVLRKGRVTDATGRTTDVVSADDVLTMNVGAGRTYIIFGRLAAQESAPGVGFKCGLGGSCTATEYSCDYANAEQAGSFQYQGQMADLTAVKNHANAAGGVSVVNLQGLLVVNQAGSFGARWARNDPSSGTATLLKGSWLMLVELA